MARTKSQTKTPKKVELKRKPPGGKKPAPQGKPSTPAKAAIRSKSKPSTRGQLPATKPKRRIPAAQAVAAKPPPIAPATGATAASKPAPPLEPAMQAALLPAAKPPRIRKPVVIPPILLEGDAPYASPRSGPGERYVLAPVPVEPAPSDVATPPSAAQREAERSAPAEQRPSRPVEPLSSSPPPPPRAPQIPDELPESYGTGRLFLIARDPHWLHAAWDLAPEQQRRMNRMARDGHLIIRAHVNDAGGPIVAEAHVHPESKSWFVHVPAAATRHVAQLGFYDTSGAWHAAAWSDPTVTPPDSMSEATAVQFATIPPDVTLEKVFEAVHEAIKESVPLVEAVAQSLPPADGAQPRRTEPRKRLPATAPQARPKWTPAQAHALAEIVRVDDLRRVWVGSLEVTEMVRRHLQREVTSPAPLMEAGELAAAPPPGPGAEVSSPAAVPQPEAAEWERAFWFNLNAELVLYGATEPDAKVTVDGRRIRLRPDGTFSYRFALPDGQYPLSLEAEAVDGSDRRSARLEFSRTTTFRGAEVHPQDPALKPPLPASVT